MLEIYEVVILGTLPHGYLRSSVLLLLCGRAGLCGGRLCGPSMLRDMMEHLLPLADVVLSLAPLVVVADVTGCDDSGSDRVSPCRLVPGVLEVERRFFGDDGALPTVLRVWNDAGTGYWKP